MAGIGRDYPSDYRDWPHGLPPAWPPEGGFPTKDKIFKAIAENPLIAPQYSYPIYSNTGYSLLGWCNTVADEKATGTPISHAEIIQRDILGPFGMNGSSFILSKHNFEQMAFPKIALEAVSTVEPQIRPELTTILYSGFRYDRFS
jgi:CubicO group peptidase (beta-lactamase class C family)